MNDLLIDAGGLCFFALIAGMALADLLARGRLEPRYRLSRRAAELAKYCCLILFLPLFQILFLVVPILGGGSIIRNSAEFRLGTTALLGLIEVLAVIRTVRAFMQWRRG